MKKFEKWAKIFILSALFAAAIILFMLFKKQWIEAIMLIVIVILMTIPFVNLWRDLKEHGMKTEFDISRVLGKEAKDALSFGNIGMITYDADYVVTWCSPFSSIRKTSLALIWRLILKSFVAIRLLLAKC